MGGTRQAKLENSRKAKEAANSLFPCEKWILLEDGIYLSPNRPIGAKSNFRDELRDAQILRDFGCTVYLVPELRRTGGKKYDAIVNGLQFEFKTVGGNANTLEHQFLRSRSQSPNVFINLETSNLSKREVISTLYGARNKLESNVSHGYEYYNDFKGGKIILKIKGQKRLIYLDVDEIVPK